MPRTESREHFVTGLGRPVVDLLRDRELPCRLWPAVITSGLGEVYADGYYQLPKRELLLGLQVLRQSGELRIAADVPEATALSRELGAMRVEIPNRGAMGGGAARMTIWCSRWRRLAGRLRRGGVGCRIGGEVGEKGRREVLPQRLRGSEVSAEFKKERIERRDVRDTGGLPGGFRDQGSDRLGECRC
jgi:hypothetical protein